MTTLLLAMYWQFALVVVTTVTVAVQGRPQDPSEYFQLVDVDRQLCLQPQKEKGTVAKCKDSAGNYTEFTVFFTTGSGPGSYSIHIRGAGSCVDREHCHSSTSNLRYSSCDHCGAIHWDISPVGKVSEDAQKNCIYTSHSGTAADIHHCSDGYTKFSQNYTKEQALLKIYDDRMRMYTTQLKMKSE